METNHLTSPKRITILAIGTRGDVQPAIAFGKALQARGHHVRLLASENFAPWIKSHGLEAAPSRVNIQEFMESEHGRIWVDHGLEPKTQMEQIKYLVETYGWQILQDSWEAARDAEIIISSFTSDIYGAAIAEKLDIPQVSMPLQPSLVASRCGWLSHVNPLPASNSPVNYWFDRLLLEPVPWQLYGEKTNLFRQKVLDLPTCTPAQYINARKRILVLHAYSPLVVPHPVDWPAGYHTTGYWFLKEDKPWQPPAALQDFLHAGPPPLYIGFGSMTGNSGQALTDMVQNMLRLTGQRAVLHTGWAGLHAPVDAAGSNLYLLESAPHAWLFPRVSAVIHHGGSGTTAAGLLAGRPTLIIPYMADQPFWGERITRLGLGPKYIPRPGLTLTNLTAAVRLMSEGPAAGEMAARAALLAEKLQAEDGLKKAVELLEASLII
ncbi:MAG: glycosyltransferase [Anaerolineae bacterium]|nr:glycosyltransferase [Anaerolineae bacterium]